MSVEPGLPRPPAVLLVEDEDGVREFVRVVLVQAGYAVTSVSEPRRALELFRADPAGFDLVLSDILMPGRSGPELAADLRALAPAVRILFMSGYPGGSATHPVRLPDGAEVLDKPFSLDGLLAAVARALGRET
jgi:DNA-binding response OmpR family regulator